MFQLLPEIRIMVLKVEKLNKILNENFQMNNGNCINVKLIHNTYTRQLYLSVTLEYFCYNRVISLEHSILVASVFNMTLTSHSQIYAQNESVLTVSVKYGTNDMEKITFKDAHVKTLY